MSGVKRLEIDEEAARRAAAARAAAEEHRRREEARVREEFARALAAARRAWDEARAPLDSFAAGADEDVALAARVLIERTEVRAGAGNDPAELRAAAGEASSAVDLLRRAREELAAADAAGADRVRERLRNDLRSASSAEDVARAVSAGGPAVDREDVLRRAEDLCHLLEACAEAGVPMDERAASLLDLARTWVAGGDYTAAIRILGRADRELDGGELEARLRGRAQELHAVVERLGSPEWSGMLREWREELLDGMLRLDRRVAGGDWTGAGATLREVDAFLFARARRRIELATEAARALGWRVEHVLEDETGGWVKAEIADERDVLAVLHEHAPRWHDLGREGLVVQGPGEWDGEACLVGGMGNWLDAMRSGGSDARLWSVEGEELHPAVGHAATSAVISPAAKERKPIAR